MGASYHCVHCLWCCNGNPNEVRLCVSKSCPLWPFRLGHRPTAEHKAEVADRVLHPAERQITGKVFHDAGGAALKAIRLRCLDCSSDRWRAAGIRIAICTLSGLARTRTSGLARSERRPWRRSPSSGGRLWLKSVPCRKLLSREAIEPQTPRGRVSTRVSSKARC